MANTENKSRIFLYVAVTIGNLIAFSAGISMGWSSPIIPKLTNETSLDENPFGVVVTSDQISWISSLLGLSSIFGPPLSGFVSAKFGRKKTLLFCSGAPLLASYLILAFGKSIILYYIARVLGGFALGALMNVLPHFLSEISEDSIRGSVSSSMNVFLNSGMLYAFIFGPYLTIMWFNISCAVWPAIFLILFLSVVPESPYYLIEINDPSGAIQSLKKFRPTGENLTKEMDAIKRSIEQDKKNVGSFRDVFKSKASIKAFTIALGLIFFQVLSGITVVFFNAQTIFNTTGSDIPSEISTIIIGSVQFGASFITPLAVDRLGRKFLLLVSAVGMLIAEVPLGLYFYMNETGQDVSSISWLPILCLIICIISYNLGFAIVPWTVMAEVFPANIKASASTLSVCFCGLLNFSSLKSFVFLNDAIGMGGTFWLYSAVCAISVPFVAFYMIETKVAFSAGVMVGWSSPVVAKLSKEDLIDDNPLGAVLTSNESSWLSSILGLGALLGPFVAGFMCNKIGRKKTLLLFSGVPFLASYLILSFAKNIYLYYTARFVGGFSYGSLLSVLPHFLSEISEDRMRGTVSSSMNVFLMSGTLYAYVVGPYLPIMWFNLSCAVWPALFLVLFFIFVPESPYYLIASNDLSSAMNSLKKCRSSSEGDILKEMETIKYSVEQDKNNVGTFFDIFKSRSCTKAFIITMTLLGVQQFSGIIVVLFNAEKIFSATGSDIPPEISTIIVGAVQFGASFITPFAVDKLGRKLLLLVSAIGMFVAEVPLGLYFHLNDNGSDLSSISWLPILCLVVYIISYNFGFGIVPWTVMAEVFPSNVKASASAVSASSCAGLSFILTFSFEYLNEAMGMGGTFWFFSACCALAVPFVIFYMVETKGRSFQEIQDILAK